MAGGYLVALLGLWGATRGLVPVHAVRVVKTRSNYTTWDCYSPYDDQHLLSLMPCTADALNDMAEAVSAGSCFELSEEKLALPVEGCASEEVVCSPAVSADLLKRFGDSVRVTSTDAGAHYRDSSGPSLSHDFVSVQDSWYQRWRDLGEQESRVNATVQNSGGVATLQNIGTSVEGRNIKAVRLTGQGYSRGKPKVFLNFNLHAREWISGMAGVYAVEKMFQKAKNDRSWLKDMELVLVPMSNPDGFHFSQTSDRFWRKNRRSNSGSSCKGVDLNRNFPKGFGGSGTSKNPCSDAFTGSKALSEPESKALAKIINEAPLTVHIDVHSYSQMLLAPWSYTPKAHPRKREWQALGNQMKSAIRSKNGRTYEVGDNLLSDAGGAFQDFSTDEGALGFTYELYPSRGNGGFAPPTRMILPVAEEVLEGFYAAVEWARQA